MSTKSKPKQAKKMSRTKIRPDDDDILEKLRVKRSISIPALDIDDEEEVSQDSTPEIEANTPTAPNPQAVAEKIQALAEPVIAAAPAVSPQPAPAAPKPTASPVVAPTAPEPSTITAPKPQSGAPKLFVSGRLPRKKGTSSRSLQLLHSIEEEMKQYCNGGDLVVLNYLIKLGLEKVKESQQIIIVDSDSL